MEKQYDSPMLRQARYLPDLIKDQYEDLEPKTRKIFSTPEIYSFQKIVLTGCGDSYAACLAVKSAFEDFARIPVDVISAIDLSRHYHKSQLNYGPNSPLVIAVSSSGSVARIVEGVLRANTTSAYTLGITKNIDSLLGQTAKKILQLNPPQLESSPGVGSYAISLLALLLLAIRFGEVKLTYTMDQANIYRKSLVDQLINMKSSLESMESCILEIAQKWKDFPAFDFVGSGADYGAVFFGHAKIFEASGQYAMRINTEEWLHLNFFLRNTEKTGTVLIIDERNEARSRALEATECMKKNSRPLLLISNDEHFSSTYCEFIELPKSEHISFSSLCQLIPLTMLSSFLASLRGEEYGRGAKGHWAFCQGGAAVQQSEIIVKEN